MSIPEIIASAILGIWFVLTVVVQLPHSSCKRVRKHDLTGHLLPGWNFFAPKPIVADFRLMYRWIPADDQSGTPGEWAPAWPVDRSRFFHAIVDPNRRPKKAIFQACHRIILAFKQQPKRRASLALSVPYLLLLDRVTVLCPRASAVQFRIDIIRFGKASPIVAFQSPMHKVDLAISST